MIGGMKARHRILKFNQIVKNKTVSKPQINKSQVFLLKSGRGFHLKDETIAFPVRGRWRVVWGQSMVSQIWRPAQNKDESSAYMSTIIY